MWNNIWTNPHIVGIYLWHQSSSSILRFCILPHQTSSSRLFWSFLGVRNSWGQTLLSFTHRGAPSLASLIFAGASQSRCHSHSHRTDNCQTCEPQKKGIPRERACGPWLEEVNKNWLNCEVKMFWLFFAAAGLAVAVAVDVGGINMNTGVNTGDFIICLSFWYL